MFLYGLLHLFGLEQYLEPQFLQVVGAFTTFFFSTLGAGSHHFVHVDVHVFLLLGALEVQNAQLCDLVATSCFLAGFHQLFFGADTAVAVATAAGAGSTTFGAGAGADCGSLATS